MKDFLSMFSPREMWEPENPILSLFLIIMLYAVIGVISALIMFGIISAVDWGFASIKTSDALITKEWFVADHSVTHCSKGCYTTHYPDTWYMLILTPDGDDVWGSYHDYYDWEFVGGHVSVKYALSLSGEVSLRTLDKPKGQADE